MKKCDNCGFKTKTQETPKGFGAACTIYNLCNICCATNLSNAVLYPTNQSDGEATIMQGVAYIGNLLLKEIRTNKK